MAVVTEGDSANSYVSVDQATEYHAQRGNAAWASASNDSRSSALIRATDYIDRSYQFRGSKVDPTSRWSFHAPAWPGRTGNCRPQRANWPCWLSTGRWTRYSRPPL